MQAKEDTTYIIFFAFIPCETNDTTLINSISSAVGVNSSSFNLLHSVYNLPTNYRLVQCSTKSVYKTSLKTAFWLKGSKLLVWPFEGKQTISQFFDHYLHKTAFVTGIPKRIDLNQIRHTINDVGKLIELNVVQNKSGNNRHYGFAIFENKEEFEKATGKKNFKLINELNGKKVKICCKGFKAIQVKKFKYSLDEVENCGTLLAIPKETSDMNKRNHPSYINTGFETGKGKKAKTNIYKKNIGNHEVERSQIQSNPSQFKNSAQKMNGYCPEKRTVRGPVRERKVIQGDKRKSNASIHRERKIPLKPSNIHKRVKKTHGEKERASDKQEFSHHGSFKIGNLQTFYPFSNVGYKEEIVFQKSGLGIRQSARTHPVLEKIEDNHLPRRNNLVFRKENGRERLNQNSYFNQGRANSDGEFDYWF